MAINALIGKPGHGKSYSAIELFVLEAAKTKRHLVTNIPLLPKLFEDFPEFSHSILDPDLVKKGPDHLAAIPGGSLVLIDEVWRIWPSGLKANAIPEYQLAFIKEHRHNLSPDGREMDIVLVTQDLSDIANAVRNMVDFTICCEKLLDVGQDNRFRRDYYRGPVRLEYRPKDKFLKSDHGCQYKSDVYQYYKSHTKSDSPVHAVDNSSIIKGSIFGSLGFKLGVFFLIFLIIAFFFLTKSTIEGVDEMKGKSKTKNYQTETALTTSTPAQVQEKPQPTKPPEPTLSKTVRLTGNYINGQAIRFYIVSNGSKTWRIPASKCKTDLETECLINGEIVTRYSGAEPSGFLTMPNFQMANLKPDTR